MIRSNPPPTCFFMCIPPRFIGDAGDEVVLLLRDVHPEKARFSRRGRADRIDDLDGRGLVGAVRAQQGENFAFPDVERQVLDRQQIPIPVRQFLDLDGVFSFDRHGSTFFLYRATVLKFFTSGLLRAPKPLAPPEFLRLRGRIWAATRKCSFRRGARTRVPWEPGCISSGHTGRRPRNQIKIYLFKGPLNRLRFHQRWRANKSFQAPPHFSPTPPTPCYH